MKKMVKFASQVEEKTLRELKTFVRETNKSISGVVTEALNEYLNKARVRPAFRNAMDEVLNENEELLKRLAK